VLLVPIALIAGFILSSASRFVLDDIAMAHAAVAPASPMTPPA